MMDNVSVYLLLRSEGSHDPDGGLLHGLLLAALGLGGGHTEHSPQQRLVVLHVGGDGGLDVSR